MKVGLTQFDIAWEDKYTNQARARQVMEQAAKKKVDLLVFPEMTLTGFTMHTQLAGEEMLGSPTLTFFKECSKQYGMAIAFGYVEAFGQEYYNKFVIVSEGKILYDYDKIHPFNYGEEGKHYTGGTEVKTACCRNMELAGFVCYDLRFPEVFQAVADSVQLMIIIANWPVERVAQWEALLRARAIENQCYMVGVNRVGEGNGLTYVASSMAFDPLGERMTAVGNEDALQVIEIHAGMVKEIRRALPFRKDRRNELYETFYRTSK